MALQTDTAVEARRVTHGRNHCPQCRAWLLAPDWSEYLNDRCVRHTWSCDACSHRFETTVYFPAAS
jgi:hypothetical protein